MRYLLLSLATVQGLSATPVFPLSSGHFCIENGVALGDFVDFFGGVRVAFSDDENIDGVWMLVADCEGQTLISARYKTEEDVDHAFQEIWGMVAGTEISTMANVADRLDLVGATVVTKYQRGVDSCVCSTEGGAY